MNVQHFVSQIINDKAFLLEACRHIPAEMLDKSNEGVEQGDTSNPDVFADLFFPAAQAMGVDATHEQVNAEFQGQLRELGGFGKMRFMFRLIRTMAKVKKGA